MLDRKKDDPHFTNCLICGKPLVYERMSRVRTCRICGKTAASACSCEDGHFVCDSCHAASSIAFFIPALLASKETDPMKLFETVIRMKDVHMHGPEHHMIVPCALITAYHNCTGCLDLKPALREAVSRGSQVPGGICGYWGSCGAAVGAGIFASIVTGSNPLSKDTWRISQMLTARCLEEIAKHGGPRCCKRTGRLAIETAVAFAKEFFGVTMPISAVQCTYSEQNRECLYRDCLYFSGKE